MGFVVGESAVGEGSLGALPEAPAPPPPPPDSTTSYDTALTAAQVMKAMGTNNVAQRLVTTQVAGTLVATPAAVALRTLAIT